VCHARQGPSETKPHASARLEALNSPELEGWTLAGGTGLALQVGHRVSEDFDFFKVEPFAGDRLYRDLSKAAAVETVQQEEGTLTVLAGGVKLSFFSVLDPFLLAGQSYSFFQVATWGIALLPAAISSRGSRRTSSTSTQCWELTLEVLRLVAAQLRQRTAQRLPRTEELTYFEDAAR
jgi:hypothetical protein